MLDRASQEEESDSRVRCFLLADIDETSFTQQVANPEECRPKPYPHFISLLFTMFANRILSEDEDKEDFFPEHYEAFGICTHRRLLTTYSDEHMPDYAKRKDFYEFYAKFYQNMINNFGILEKGYTLALMESLSGDLNNAEFGKIYLSEAEGRYCVRKPEGVVESGSLKSHRHINLKNLSHRLDEGELINNILAVTSKAKHTFQKKAAQQGIKDYQKLLDETPDFSQSDSNDKFITSIVSNLEKMTGLKCIAISTPEDAGKKCGYGYASIIKPYEEKAMLEVKKELEVPTQIPGWPIRCSMDRTRYPSYSMIEKTHPFPPTIQAFNPCSKNAQIISSIKHIMEQCGKEDDLFYFDFVDDVERIVESAKNIPRESLPENVVLRVYKADAWARKKIELASKGRKIQGTGKIIVATSSAANEQKSVSLGLERNNLFAASPREQRPLQTPSPSISTPISKENTPPGNLILPQPSDNSPSPFL